MPIIQTKNAAVIYGFVEDFPQRKALREIKDLRD